MKCVVSCLSTWIYWLWLWIWRLSWLYCNGFLLNNTWWWMLLEVGFLSSMRVSQGISCITFFVGMLSILLHVNFDCIFILDLLWVMWKWLYYLFPSLYQWYQSYGFIIVTLDWIHGNGWEDEREGNIYELFIVDLMVLGFLLWWYDG